VPPLSVIVAEPVVTVESKPRVNFSTVLVPPVNVPVATLFAFVVFVLHITMPSAGSAAVNTALFSTRNAPPRPLVTWLPTVTAPVAVRLPPSTDKQP